MDTISASVTIGEQGWAVTWRLDSNTPLYMQHQLAFEARRCAERATGERP